MITGAKKTFALFVLLVLVACAEAKSTPQATNMLGTLIPVVTSPTNQPSDTPTPFPYPLPSQPNNNPTPFPSLSPSLSPSPLPSPTISPTAQVRPTYYFGHLQMFDANIGWIVYFDFLAKDSKILRTTDGIKTWINVSPSIPESNSLCAAFFMDINTAVVVSCRTFLPEPLKKEVTAWQTTDGGHTWQTGETFLLDQDCFPLGDQIMFLDKYHGWMMCASTRSMHHSWIALFETQDGGMHWKTVYDTPHHLAGPDPLWISGFYPYSEYFTFVTEMTGFFSNRKMFITRDGGKSWLSDPLDPPVDLPDIDCKSDMGECKYLNTVSIPRFTSIQDGVLMRRVYTNTEDASLVFIYNASTVHLPLPKAQYLYYTHDGGQTWIPRPSPAKIGTVYFQDAKTGWFLGKNDPDPSTLTQLYQTADGGTTWKQISSDCALPLGSEIQFVNEKTGYAFETFTVSRYYRDYDARVKTAKSSDIYYTDDGGHSWVKIELQLTP